ncbi:hypothetical protein K0A97_03275 [Patescibacteria group bacterium]|nr:hypothetical protein [Patescibacteria group bacterium]
MQKEKGQNKKWFLVAGIFIFLILAFALNFVNVSEPTQKIPTTITGQSIIGDMFTDWSSGSLDVTIAKYLFWIIVAMLVTAALSFARFPPNGFIQFILGIIVSFLATAYITPDEVFVVLTSYTALGLTLVSILPFVIIIFFSAMLLSNENINDLSIGRIMMQIMLWLFFIGFLIYKLVAGYTGGEEMSLGARIVLFAVLGLSGLILVFNRRFRTWIRRFGLEIRSAEQQRIRHDQREAARQQAEAAAQAHAATVQHRRQDRRRR